MTMGNKRRRSKSGEEISLVFRFERPEFDVPVENQNDVLSGGVCGMCVWI